MKGSVYNQRSGEVFLQDFDRGVVETLGSEINVAGDTYVLKSINGVEPPPDYEGVPVYFAFPDETIDNKILPSIVIRRDGITPALSRWHLGAFDYNVPAPEAQAVNVVNPITGEIIASGFDQYERKDQAVPYDLLYTIQIRARFRNNLKAEGLKMLRYVMSKYQPYTRLEVKDTLNDTRYYDAFMETPTGVDIVPDVAGRETNFNLTLRVEAELDLNEPYVTKVLTQPPSANLSIK